MFANETKEADMKKIILLMGLTLLLAGCNQGGTGDNYDTGRGTGSSANTNQDNGQGGAQGGAQPGGAESKPGQ